MVLPRLVAGVVHAPAVVGGLLVNRRLHAGAVALACFGALLIFIGWLGFQKPAPLHCGDSTCEEAHP